MSKSDPEKAPAVEKESHKKSPANPIPSAKKQFDINDLFNALFLSLRPDPQPGADKTRDDLIKEYICQEIENNPISESYNILILHDEGRMVKSDADYIYSASAAFTDNKPLLLILYSSGGVIGSAYLIGKLCRQYSNNKFVVVIPRQAKSAATLICCAADEIHMGSLSELGPIDPQIDNLPALGLKASVEHIADLIKAHPHAADMFAKYLNMSLQPIHLGYYERVAESASQYAERLLKLHKSNLVQKPSQIAHDLVYSYKDHGFVIDKSDATEIFGEKIIKTDTDEYKLGNSIYAALMRISRFTDMMNYSFYFIGSCDSKPSFSKRT